MIVQPLAFILDDPYLGGRASLGPEASEPAALAPTNVPEPVSELIGRDDQLAEVVNLVGAHRLVTLEVDADNADASGFEPIWRGQRRVGFVTSGGYGHTVAKSLAMAYVDTEVAAAGTELDVHIVGDKCRCRVIAPSPFDPAGKRMRS